MSRAHTHALTRTQRFSALGLGWYPGKLWYDGDARQLQQVLRHARMLKHQRSLLTGREELRAREVGPDAVGVVVRDNRDVRHVVHAVTLQLCNEVRREEVCADREIGLEGKQPLVELQEKGPLHLGREAFHNPAAVTGRALVARLEEVSVAVVGTRASQRSQTAVNSAPTEPTARSTIRTALRQACTE